MTSAGDYTVLRSIIGNYSFAGGSAWTTNQPIVTTNQTASTAVGTGSLIANGGASFAGDVNGDGFPDVIVGNTDASTTRKPSTLCTRKRASTTEVAGSVPIIQLLVG
jgi:hypothetical protein